MNKNISVIYNLTQELSWHFGSHGFNGECCGDLTLVEFMALKKILETDSTTIQELGNALNFTKGGSSKVIDRLEYKGYALRKNSPLDGRVCCVSVTVKGKEAISKIVKNYTAYLDEVLKEFDPQKVKNIRNALEILLKAIQQKKPFNSDINNHMGGERS